MWVDRGKHWSLKHLTVALRCCCSWCPFKAERYLTVKKHIQSEHETKQNYPCPQCSFIGKISSKGARFYWRSTFSAPSMMEYASHMDSHKGKQGQKTSWLLKGNRSNLAKFQPLEIKTTSQRKEASPCGTRCNHVWGEISCTRDTLRPCVGDSIHWKCM